MSRIGDKIQKARNEKGISAKQFAKKLGVAEKFITEVEQGRKIMNEMLIDKASKILETNLNDLALNFTDKKSDENKIIDQKKGIIKEKEISPIWNDALSSVLKSIPIYDYNLNRVLGKKSLPVISNKIEGYSQDKVMFIFVDEDDMIGFRIAKGDIAFAHTINELQDESLCLVEYKNKRAIRQIKKIDSNKVLLISNRGSVMTETVNVSEVKPLAKIDKVEIKF